HILIPLISSPTPPPPNSPLFPYTTLFRSQPFQNSDEYVRSEFVASINNWVRLVGTTVACLTLLSVAVRAARSLRIEKDQKTLDSDRKSTRLNSSHVSISYAVFCLKKKNKI